ncbi:hypothetical protein EJMLMN_EJMLMN_12525, partial [Dysosmobacter welbionis]
RTSTPDAHTLHSPHRHSAGTGRCNARPVFSRPKTWRSGPAHR